MVTSCQRPVMPCASCWSAKVAASRWISAYHGFRGGDRPDPRKQALGGDRSGTEVSRCPSLEWNDRRSQLVATKEVLTSAPNDRRRVDGALPEKRDKQRRSISASP